MLALALPLRFLSFVLEHGDNGVQKPVRLGLKRPPIPAVLAANDGRQHFAREARPSKGEVFMPAQFYFAL